MSASSVRGDSAYAAWLACAAIAHNLTRAAATLAGGCHTRTRTGTEISYANHDDQRWIEAEIYLANGNGILNAFAAQATGYGHVVLSNELFVNLHNNNSAGLRFILGHETRPGTRSRWPTFRSSGPRCPGCASTPASGAYLSPAGTTRLVLLASGPYTRTTST